MLDDILLKIRQNIAWRTHQIGVESPIRQHMRTIGQHMKWDNIWFCCKPDWFVFNKFRRLCNRDTNSFLLPPLPPNVVAPTTLYSPPSPCSHVYFEIQFVFFRFLFLIGRFLLVFLLFGFLCFLRQDVTFLDVTLLFANSTCARGATSTLWRRRAPPLVCFLHLLPMRAPPRTGLNLNTASRCTFLVAPRWI